VTRRDYDIHGVVSLAVFGNGPVLDRLRLELGRFETARALPQPDVVVRPLGWARAPAGALACSGASPVRYLVAARAVELWYQDEPAAGRRIYGPLLVALATALRRRGAFLLHAAALRVDGPGVVLVGPRGSGTTATACAHLAQGAGYVGEDKVVLAGGHVHLLQTLVSLRPYHRPLLPEVARRAVRDAPARRLVAAVAAAVLPAALARRLGPAARSRVAPEATSSAMRPSPA